MAGGGFMTTGVRLIQPVSCHRISLVNKKVDNISPVSYQYIHKYIYITLFKITELEQ